MLISKVSFLNDNPYINSIKKTSSFQNFDALKPLQYDTVDFKNVSFGSRAKYNVNLVSKKDGSYIPAKFSELKVSNEEDLHAIWKITSFWERPCDEDNFICDINNEFVEDRNDDESYFAIEIADKNKELWDRIVCVAMTTNTRNRKTNQLGVRFVQTNPEILEGKLDIKGAGELTMYGIVKLAKEKKFDLISLQAQNEEFYKHIGFREFIPGYNAKDGKYISPIYVLNAREYDEFMRRVETKYGFSG